MQNGAVLGRIFQPHESHLPFILQFLIDYNLYGMSFLYTPASIVQHRQHSNDSGNSDQSNSGDQRKFLDKKHERMTVSKQEFDIAAGFILNRFQMPLHENVEHANPGIAFLWNDERNRRKKMGDAVSIA